MFHKFMWPFFFIAKVVRMHICLAVMLAEPQGNTQLTQRLSTTFSLAQNEAAKPLLERAPTAPRVTATTRGVANSRVRALAQFARFDAHVVVCAEGFAL